MRIIAIVTGLALLTACEAAQEPQSQEAETPPENGQSDPPPAEEDPVMQPGEPHGVDTAYLEHPWAVKGGDCRKPDFDINLNPAGDLTVETSLNGSPRTGYVAQGDEPRFVFDALELPVEGRGVDGLAVMPPEYGELTLGGVAIKGDGAVFIQCPEPG
ncbi:MAG: hypothetical protein H2040_01605 [Euryhalocaulis sp.]|uniref:hypothetical protein n=1 Tax=Euryhalocaulis sp. TaxID=2744307 RepID=UPI0017CD3897|nr:hypothetical protein [Euryhalocaulis sp.]MBA4800537.1 hypothetical protein [Euryhalocaulis sp.]